MKTIVVEGLPDDPLDAAGVFHQHWLPHAEASLVEGEDLLLVFAPADHTHRGWRAAAVQGLARRYAPARANATTGDGAANERISSYFEGAPGVTGQYLEAAPANR